MVEAVLSTAIATPSYDLRMTVFTRPATTPAVSVNTKDLHASLVNLQHTLHS